MIAGDKELRIKEYLPIDRMGEGCGFVNPSEGEVFVGVPYGYRTDNSEPFIEVRKNGVLIRTVNALDISEIHFDESGKP